MTPQRKRSAIQDPALRRLVTAVLLEYRLAGSTATNENLKHVRRMARLVRKNQSQLAGIGVNAEVLEVAILISDLGKEPHFIRKNSHHYGSSAFRAFMDHSRISMREGNLIRKKVGVTNEVWRSILKSFIGHDGPAIEGSWWKLNYEQQLGKPYPRIRTREALIHCYLDRLDQGGVYRGIGNQLNGGLRKISYELFGKEPPAGGISAVIREVFGPARTGTQQQLAHLDQVELPRFLGASRELPAFLAEHRAAFDQAEIYFGHVEFRAENPDIIRIRVAGDECVQVNHLDDFWRVLSTVTPDGQSPSLLRKSALA